MGGKDSMVGTGDRQVGDRLGIFHHLSSPLREIDSIHGVEVGKQVVLSRGTEFLRTSPIVRLLDRGDDYIEFETKTSIYRLESVLDEDDESALS